MCEDNKWDEQTKVGVPWSFEPFLDDGAQARYHAIFWVMP